MWIVNVQHFVMHRIKHYLVSIIEYFSKYRLSTFTLRVLILLSTWFYTSHPSLSLSLSLSLDRSIDRIKMERVHKTKVSIAYIFVDSVLLNTFEVYLCSTSYLSFQFYFQLIWIFLSFIFILYLSPCISLSLSLSLSLTQHFAWKANGVTDARRLIKWKQ